MYKTNKKFIIAFMILIIIFSIGYYFYNQKDGGEIFSYNDGLDKNAINNTEKNLEVKEKMIKVHVAGYVINPGVLELPVESRISDAIEEAGGLTEEADISKINLAYLIEDGMKIYIPNHTEIEEEKNMNTSEIKEEEYINESSGLRNEEISGTENKKNEKININTATQKDLETLPGIGSATALKIISHRNENGKFKDIEDIKNVKGIGDSKFENIKNLICVK